MNLSIITVNYNDHLGLDRTLSSVSSLCDCAHKDVEVLVIDGGSRDGSLNVIKKNRKLITKYISEPDFGIYDAMNKGLSIARGKYTLFLNSGDYISDNKSLKRILELVRMGNGNDIIFWRANIVDDLGNVVKIYPDITHDNIDKWFLYPMNLPNHQAMLFPKKFYIKNKYDLNFKINGDADYKIRSMRLFEYKFVDENLSSFVLGGVSSKALNFTHYKKRLNELFMLARKNFKGSRMLILLVTEFSKLTVKMLLGLINNRIKK